MRPSRPQDISPSFGLILAHIPSCQSQRTSPESRVANHVNQSVRRAFLKGIAYIRVLSEVLPPDSPPTNNDVLMNVVHHWCRKCFNVIIGPVPWGLSAISRVCLLVTVGFYWVLFAQGLCNRLGAETESRKSVCQIMYGVLWEEGMVLIPKQHFPEYVKETRFNILDLSTRCTAS